MSFERKELNQIIHHLRKNAPYIFGNCGAIFKNNANEAKLLTKNSKLIPKNSASLTDVVLSQAEIGTGRDAKKFNVAMKIWFGWDAVKSVDRRFIKYCTGGKPGGVCTEDTKKLILKKLILPETKISDGKPVPTDDLFKSSLKQLADASNTESLTYEARLYSYITENIIMRNVSPNFVPILSASSCDISVMIPIFEKNIFSGGDKIIEKLKLINKIFGDEVSFNFIITGSGNNMVKFKDLLITHTLQKEEAANIIYQALYAFYVMDKYNIFHGDLHAENLFIQILDEEVNLSYVVNGRKTVFCTKYVFKIYDFDRSYLDMLGENSKSYDFIVSGMDNYMRRNADFAHFICLCVQHEHESGSAKKPFTSVLKEIEVNSKNLYVVGELEYNAKPDTDKMGQCGEESVKLSSTSSTLLYTWIQNNPNSIHGKDKDFIRISPLELSTILTADEYKNITDIFGDDYLDIVSRLLIQYSISRKIITLYICRQWLCSPSNDINIDINYFFETDTGFRFITKNVSPTNPLKETLDYEYKPLFSPKTPALELNILYPPTSGVSSGVVEAPMIIEEPEPELVEKPIKRPRKRLTELERLKYFF